MRSSVLYVLAAANAKKDRSPLGLQPKAATRAVASAEDIIGKACAETTLQVDE